MPFARRELAARRKPLVVILPVVVALTAVVVIFAVPVMSYSYACQVGEGCFGGGCHMTLYTYTGLKSLGAVVFGYGGFTVGGAYYFGGSVTSPAQFCPPSIA